MAVRPGDPSDASEIVTPLTTGHVSDLARAHVARCESPLCLLDGAYLGTIWFSDEPLCGARGLGGDIRHAQTAMRKLARVRAPGYFELRHLTAIRRVSRRTWGWDPDAPLDTPRRLSARKAAMLREEALEESLAREKARGTDRVRNSPSYMAPSERGGAVGEGAPTR